MTVFIGRRSEGMSSKTTQVVHESESQRQHVRLQVAARAEIQGKFYQVRDMSSGGLRVQGIEKSLEPGTQTDIKLEVPFEGFALKLDMKVRAGKVDSKHKTLGLTFTALSESQISILNFILKSTMTGTVVTEGDIIHIAGRNNFVQRRQESADAQEKNKSPAALIRRITPTAALVLTGLVGLVLILGSIYKNVAVIASPRAVVEGNIIIARSTADGVFYSLVSEDMQEVSEGQFIGEIEISVISQTTNKPVQTKLIVQSPCDCQLIHQYARNGEFRAMGEPLFKLIPVASVPWISAMLKPEEALRLREDGKAHISIAGQDTYLKGHIKNIGFKPGDNSVAVVKVIPDENISASLISRPAFVEFRLH